MRPMSGRDFARVVELHGWNGNHHIYGKPGITVRLSVRIHGNRPLKLGLLRHLAKLANVPDEELN